MNPVNANQKSIVFETILSSPGMNEKCKIVLQLSRQNTLLLSRLIEVGLLTHKNPSEDEIISAFPKTSIEEFRTVQEDILNKSSLTDFYERLKQL